MSGERPITPELFTEFFFNRPAEIVVADLAAQVYGIENDHTVIQAGNPKLLQLALDEELKTYRIMTAQAYQQINATKIWRGKRSEQIDKHPPGGVVTYRSTEISSPRGRGWSSTTNPLPSKLSLRGRTLVMPAALTPGKLAMRSVACLKNAI